MARSILSLSVVACSYLLLGVLPSEVAGAVTARSLFKRYGHLRKLSTLSADFKNYVRNKFNEVGLNSLSGIAHEALHMFDMDLSNHYGDVFVSDDDIDNYELEFTMTDEERFAVLRDLVPQLYERLHTLKVKLSAAPPSGHKALIALLKECEIGTTNDFNDLVEVFDVKSFLRVVYDEPHRPLPALHECLLEYNAALEGKHTGASNAHGVHEPLVTRHSAASTRTSAEPAASKSAGSAPKTTEGETTTSKTPATANADSAKAKSTSQASGAEGGEGKPGAPAAGEAAALRKEAASASFSTIGGAISLIAIALL